MHKSTSENRPLRWRRLVAATLLAVGASLSAMAAEQNLLVLIFHDGHKQSYVLADRPKVTFEGSTLHVDASAVSDTYTVAEVNKFVFDKGDATAIAPVSAGETRLTLTDGVHATLEGLTPGTAVRVYDLSGHTFQSAAADADGKAHVSLSGLQGGVYVISTADGKSYKILKR